MSVGVRVDSIVTEIGSQDFLHSFFSTISYHLEPKGWGTRFPEIMNDLYQGHLDASNAEKVLRELNTIREELKRFQPDQVIWDIENLKAKPPWGNNISSQITDLSNYFVTSTGRDLFATLIEMVAFLKEEGGMMTIDQV